MRSLEHLAPGFPQHPIRVLGIAGSLRRDSYNARLIEAAARQAPPGLTIARYEGLGAIPLFNEDVEAAGVPAGVTDLSSAIEQAEAVLISTPEYNQSMPGVVKNMVDWLSRAEPCPFEGKPVGIIGATAGPWGTRLAQAALRHTLTACGALIMPTPQVYVRNAGEAFDQAGLLQDERTRAALQTFLASFQHWIGAAHALQPKGVPV
jgi:chromate reductase, NAD(P)H dehydrogenase (quinone)